MQKYSFSDSSMFFDVSDFGMCTHKDRIPPLCDLQSFVFLYFSSGKSEIHTLNHSFSINSGEFIICRPYELTDIKTSNQEAFSFYWAVFSGRLVSEFLSNIGLATERKLHIEADGEVATIFDKILSEELHKQSNSDVIITSSFISALGIMSRIATDSPQKDKIKGYDKIFPALDAINSDCTDRKGVEEYAKMCNLSSSYFTHLFTKIIGSPPIEYKQLRRMDIAKKLLITTRLSVKEISTIIGFNDPLYFARCFKQTVGKSPSQFRTGK